VPEKQVDTTIKAFKLNIIIGILIMLLTIADKGCTDFRHGLRR